MSDNERLAVVEKSVELAHDKIRVHEKELALQRELRREHDAKLYQHEGILTNYARIFDDMKEAIKDLSSATKQNTATISSFKTMAITAIFMGGSFITFCGFVGGKLLHWW